MVGIGEVPARRIWGTCWFGEYVGCRRLKLIESRHWGNWSIIISTSYQGFLKDADFGFTQLVAMRINLALTALGIDVPILLYFTLLVASWTVHLLCLSIEQIAFQVSLGPVAQLIEFV